jgi:hypothetical protein
MPPCAHQCGENDYSVIALHHCDIMPLVKIFILVQAPSRCGFLRSSTANDTVNSSFTPYVTKDLRKLAPFPTDAS